MFCHAIINTNPKRQQGADASLALRVSKEIQHLRTKTCMSRIQMRFAVTAGLTKQNL
jgi:hypothetical protein